MTPLYRKILKTEIQMKTLVVLTRMMFLFVHTVTKPHNDISVSCLI